MNWGREYEMGIQRVEVENGDVRLDWRRYARWKSRTVLRPIPVAPPVRTTTLSFRVESREGFICKCAIASQDFVCIGYEMGRAGR